MRTTAHNQKKGFTLIELLVVISIVVLTSLTLGAGAVYLQNAMSIDNVIRMAKSEVQSTQNLARNSFFSNDSSSSNATVLSSKRVTVGWVVSFETNSSARTVSTVKRSAYVVLDTPSAPYDYGLLRGDILRLRSFLQGKEFKCNPGNDALILEDGRNVKFSSGASETDVFCAKRPAQTADGTTANTSDREEYMNTVVLNNAKLAEPGSLPSESMPMCFSNSSSVSIFFTAGYGEPAASRSTNCQIQIGTRSTLVNQTRSILFNVNSGSVTTCGRYCVLEATGGYSSPPIKPPPSAAPLF